MRTDDMRELCDRVLGCTMDDYLNDTGEVFRPFTNAMQAMALVEAMRAAGWAFDTAARDKYWVARFYAKDDDGPLGDVHVTQIGKTFCEAVCNAALAAVRSKP